jgi:pyruvoyl-dependent arginine decarboxylase (PvlArgDC)
MYGSLSITAGTTRLLQQMVTHPVINTCCMSPLIPRRSQLIWVTAKNSQDRLFGTQLFGSCTSLLSATVARRPYYLRTEGAPDNARPIRTIQNLHEALEKHNLTVTRLMGTDSAGGHYARALAVAMEADQLSHAFFSETSGFVHRSQVGLAIAMTAIEIMVNGRTNSRLSPDIEKLDTEKIKHFSEVYSTYAGTEERQELVRISQEIKELDGFGSRLTSLQALRHGPRIVHGVVHNPLAEDTNAMLAKQPNAFITYGVATRDPLYINEEVSHGAVIYFLQAIAVQNAGVRVVMIPGMTHTYNTYFPSLYHDIKRYALLQPQDAA